MFALKPSKAKKLERKAKRAEPGREEKDTSQANPVWQSLALGSAAIHPKLSVSQPGDADEREADRVAERVLRMPTPAAADVKLATFSSDAPKAHRSRREEEEEGKVQHQPRRVVGQATASTDRGPLKGVGQPLDSAARSFFEPRFGQDFGNVRIHTDEQSAHQASSLQAEAFTVGSNIAFNVNRFEPNTSSGRRLLAHELAHVAQQQAGPTRGATATRIQRVPVRAEAPTPAQIRAMTVAEFESLATRQLDWFSSPSLNTPLAAADLALFRQILDFARELPIILPTCGGMLVSDLIAAVVPGVFVPLRTYARGANSARSTAWLRTTSNVNTAVAWANDLLSLEAASDPGILRLTMPQPDPVANPSAFEQLVAGPYIAAFVNYLNRVHPVLSSADGSEVFSYVLLRGEGVDPVTYLGRINYVRDYHHFTRDALDGLVTNEAVTTAQQQNWFMQQPLTLVLHTTIDDTHAFHRKAGITALIRDPDMLTIVLEGLPTLGDYQRELGAIARRYGIGGRIEQVLIAGHGNFNVVGLAGTVAAGGLVQQERLQNAGGPEQVATENLVRALVAVMSADPARRRIVLAACLTASHSVTSPVDPNNPAAASAQIRNAITLTPNIRDFLQNIVGVGSTVIGGRASIVPEAGLDPSGRVALNVPADPHLMGTLVDYIEFGTEPEGALRAVVEGWATDRAVAPPATLTRDAMDRRIRRPAGGIDWYEQIIRGIYDRALKQYWANGAMINSFTGLAGLLTELYFPANDQVTNLWAKMGALPAADVDKIFTSLTTSATWGNQLRIRLIFNQVWMRHIAARGADFLTALGQFATCGEAFRYLDMNVVRPVIGALLTIPPPVVPDAGQLRLALIEAHVNPVGRPAPVVLPPHVQFLRALLGAGPNFPPALNIAGLTTGLTDEAGILLAIDRGPAAPPPPPPARGVRPAADRPRPNVDLSRNGINDFYLEPLAKTGAVTNCVFLNVRSLPWIGNNIRDRIAVGTAVRIVGRHLNWFGIEHRGRIRFVHSDYIQVN